MTIGKKIIGGYVLVLALLAIMTAVAFYSLQDDERAYAGFLDVDTQSILGATELRQEARDQAAQYRGLLLYPERHSVLLSELRDSMASSMRCWQKCAGSPVPKWALVIVDEIAACPEKVQRESGAGGSAARAGKTRRGDCAR